MFRDGGRRRGPAAGRLLLGVLTLLAVARPALAHQLKVFAYVEGKRIRGETYVRGGAGVRGAAVTAYDPSGQKLAETTTDDDGNFVLDALQLQLFLIGCHAGLFGFGLGLFEDRRNNKRKYSTCHTRLLCNRHSCRCSQRIYRSQGWNSFSRCYNRHSVLLQRPS